MKKRADFSALFVFFELLLDLKRVLIQTADGASEIGGNILPLRAGCDSLLGIALGGIAFGVSGIMKSGIVAIPFFT